MNSFFFFFFFFKEASQNVMVDSDVFSVSPVLDVHGESLRCRNVPAGTKGLVMAVQRLWS